MTPTGTSPHPPAGEKADGDQSSRRLSGSLLPEDPAAAKELISAAADTLGRKVSFDRTLILVCTLFCR